jgi:DNA-binding transcriptional LysR family regulator
MLDLSRLRLLRAVVATGSIRASASALGYTPSAVSQQLAALQRETGLRLLDRVGRGIEPTVAGRTLAEEAERLFEAVSRVEAVVGELRAGRIGGLSIGYFASAGATWLPPVVAALRTEFPELRLDLRMTEFGGDADIDIFVENPSKDRSDRAEVRWLVDDPYFAIVREDDPLAPLAEVPLEELAGRRWVDNDLNHGACRQVLIDACAKVGFSPQFAVEMHDYTTAIPFVATGIGITVVPRLGIGTLPDGLTSIPVVSPTPVRHIGIAVKRSIAQHPAAQRVVELLETITGAPKPLHGRGKTPKAATKG